MIVEDKETTELVERATQISDLSPHDQQEWLKCMGKSLGKWGDLEDFTIMGQAKILHTVWSLWDEARNEYGVALSREATSEWGYDFYCWARSYSKKRLMREPAQETIDNKISVYRDWVLGNIKTPSVVFLPKRDTQGNIISEENENDWKQIEFDPEKCDYGKLLVARGAAKKGMMSPDAWSCLCDPFATVGELKEAIFGQGTKTHKGQDSFRLWEKDGQIFASEEDKTVVIAMLNFGDNDHDPLFKRGISHLLRGAGVKVPLEYQE